MTTKSRIEQSLFKDLNIGDRFIKYSEFFIKTDDFNFNDKPITQRPHNAVCLSNKHKHLFGSKVKVDKIK